MGVGVGAKRNREKFSEKLRKKIMVCVCVCVCVCVRGAFDKFQMSSLICLPLRRYLLKLPVCVCECASESYRVGISRAEELGLMLAATL